MTGPVHVLHVGGDVDFAVRREFDAAIDQAIATGKSPLLIDLRAVRFMDSTGINGLIRAHNAMRAKGDRLGLVIDNPTIRRTLAICGLEDILAIHDDLASGVAGVRGVE